MDDLRCTQYVRQLGLSVISVDYRLAPEYPFPAALDDCYAAIRWAGSHHHQLGIDPQHFAVGGSSAGGGLAAALAQRTRDRQEFKLLFQLLIYPMLDHRTAIRVDFEDSKNILWTQKSNRFGWESYLGKMCGTEHVPAYSAPARCQDLSGLPPAWIGVGTSDLFHDEDTAYAQRLKECGLSCELEVVQGAFHGFDVLATQAPISQAFQKSQLAALKRYLFPSDTTDA
jgi:acetyl esterase/lipase